MEQVLLGLTSGLHALGPSPDEFVIVTGHELAGALAPYASSTVSIAARRPDQSLADRLRRSVGRLGRPLGALRRRALGLVGTPVEVQRPLPSAHELEAIAPDVVHLAYPLHLRVGRLPTVLSIYDLQHRHLPRLFTPATLAWREFAYPVAIDAAEVVVTDSEWVRADLVRQYAVAPEKVVVAPLASVLALGSDVTPAEVAAVRRRRALPQRFALFPAVTYEHKNHRRLLEAFAILERQGSSLSLVCTGALKHHWPRIRDDLGRLGLERRVRFLGYVPQVEMRAIFRAARLLVFPSLFEGAGLPVIEALAERLPIACADIPAPREYAGDAAVYFDPLLPEDMARVVARVDSDEGLREDLIRRGAVRSAAQTWRACAERHVQAYRMALSPPRQGGDHAVAAIGR